MSPAKTLWTFSTWKRGYSSLVYSTYHESLSERAQKTIVKCGATSSTRNRVIRLFYGEKYSKSGTLINPSTHTAVSCRVECVDKLLVVGNVIEA